MQEKNELSFENWFSLGTKVGLTNSNYLNICIPEVEKLFFFTTWKHVYMIKVISSIYSFLIHSI